MSCSNFQVDPAHGGTGVDGSSASNGQLLIGNGSGYSLGTITAGSGIDVSNGSGTITISNTGVLSITITQPAAGLTITGSGSPQTGTVTYTLALANDLAALEALSGTNTIYYRSGTDTWTAVAIGSGLSFSGGTLSATGGGGTVTSVDITPPASGISASGGPITTSGSITLSLTDDLLALESLSSTGIAVRTASSTWTTRSLDQPAAGITISNAGGVLGNPTFALANDLSAVEGLSGTGIAVRTATDTWTTRTITGTTNRIGVTNGDGVSGNPTLDVGSDVYTVGGTDVSVADGGTGRSSATAYAVLCGGTTSTGAHQSVAALGAAGTVLTSNGAGALPTFQAVTGTGTVTSVDITAPAAGITATGGPITTSGSITLALANDLAALEALSGTDTIYYRSGTSTWSAVTIGTGLSFSSGTLSNTVTGTVTSVTAGTGLTGGTITTTGTIALDTSVPQAQTFRLTNASTNTQDTVLTVDHASSGTPANNFGSAVSFLASSASVASRSLGNIKMYWTTATDASRQSAGTISAYNQTTERIAITWAAGSTQAGVGFLGANPATQQTGDAGTALVTFGLMSGTPTFDAANLTGSSLPSTLVATQANQESASSTVLAVTPGRQQYHPSACKGWVRFNGTGTVAIDASYNVTSITDNGTGDWTINWDTDFSSANYAVVITCGTSGGGVIGAVLSGTTAPAAGTTRLAVLNASFALTDADKVMACAFGDQ